jgi:UDPglucose 6-dehydrogenase
MTTRPRLTVLGTGYLGITHAACMAYQGLEVLGVDTDPEKVARLSRGELPVFEPQLGELLRDSLDSGKLSFTTSYQQAAAFGDVHFICVGTPQRHDGNGADLTQVDACVSALAPLLTRPCLVVGKSTVPAGTAAAIAADIARRAPAGESVEVCWNPEFLREGHAVQDTLTPDRIVVGVASPRGEAVIRDIYAGQLAAGVPLYVTDLATAELAKVAANAFLATKISFINAMAEVCDAAEADVTVLGSVLGSDPRIGPAFLNPGLGFGGGCLPKDIRAFMARASELGADGAAGLLREVDTINLRRRAWVAELACELIGGSPAGEQVCVLGAAFKPGSDDVRDSPALDVAQILHGMGACVVVYDPVAIDNARRACPELRYAASAREAATGAQVVLVLTEWPEFGQIDPAELGEVAAPQRAVIDARHALDRQRWQAAGWDYRAPGVPAASAVPTVSRAATAPYPELIGMSDTASFQADQRRHGSLAERSLEVCWNPNVHSINQESKSW